MKRKAKYIFSLASLCMLYVLFYTFISQNKSELFVNETLMNEGETLRNNIYGDPSENGSYFWDNLSKEELITSLIEKYKIDWKFRLDKSPWQLAESWVNTREIYPEIAPEMGAILHAMATEKIISANVSYYGTQLKLDLILEGGQSVIFRPKWYERDQVATGKIFASSDRHNGEIAAFHLNRLLGFRASPLVVGRVLDLEKEIKPVADQGLLQTFFRRGNNTCFYGMCRGCFNEKSGVCGTGPKLEGAVVLWLPSSYTMRIFKHPWGRAYKNSKVQTRMWEYDNEYCRTVKLNLDYEAYPRLLDIIDASIFDYLIGNPDRHDFELYGTENDSMLVMLDNAKSFGNPYEDDRLILAPLYQCCQLRQKTFDVLLKLRRNVLTIVLKHILDQEPIAPVLTGEHYIAMDRRLIHIHSEVENCIKKNGVENVLFPDDPGPIPLMFWGREPGREPVLLDLYRPWQKVPKFISRNIK